MHTLKRSGGGWNRWHFLAAEWLATSLRIQAIRHSVLAVLFSLMWVWPFQLSSIKQTVLSIPALSWVFAVRFRLLSKGIRLPLYSHGCLVAAYFVFCLPSKTEPPNIFRKEFSLRNKICVAILPVCVEVTTYFLIFWIQGVWVRRQRIVWF